MFSIEKISNSFHQETFEFIKTVYKDSGYTFEKKEYLKYSSQRTIFNLHDNGEIFGTIALIREKDNLSLPIYGLYKKEIDLLKKKTPIICEIGNFAIDKTKKNLLGLQALRGTKILFGETLSEANKQSIDLILIAVNPKHVSFYELMGFERIGKNVFYQEVNDEAVGLKIKPEQIKSHYFFATT